MKKNVNSLDDWWNKSTCSLVYENGNKVLIRKADIKKFGFCTGIFNAMYGVPGLWFRLFKKLVEKEEKEKKDIKIYDFVNKMFRSRWFWPVLIGLNILSFIHYVCVVDSGNSLNTHNVTVSVVFFVISFWGWYLSLRAGK